MKNLSHLVDVLRARFYTISVKRALWNLLSAFAAAALGAILIGKSINEAAALGLSAAGTILLGYLQDARKGCSFKDQVARRSKGEEIATLTNGGGGIDGMPAGDGSDGEAEIRDGAREAGDNQ